MPTKHAVAAVAVVAAAHFPRLLSPRPPCSWGVALRAWNRQGKRAFGNSEVSFAYVGMENYGLSDDYAHFLLGWVCAGNTKVFGRERELEQLFQRLHMRVTVRLVKVLTILWLLRCSLDTILVLAVRAAPHMKTLRQNNRRQKGGLGGAEKRIQNAVGRKESTSAADLPARGSGIRGRQGTQPLPSPPVSCLSYGRAQMREVK